MKDFKKTLKNLPLSITLSLSFSQSIWKNEEFQKTTIFEPKLCACFPFIFPQILHVIFWNSLNKIRSPHSLHQLGFEFRFRMNSLWNRECKRWLCYFSTPPIIFSPHLSHPETYHIFRLLEDRLFYEALDWVGRVYQSHKRGEGWSLRLWQAIEVLLLK